MRKISQKNLDKLKARGAIVKSKGIPPKPKPKPKQTTQPNKLVKNPIPGASLDDAVSRLGESNKKAVEALGNEIKTLVDQKRTPWEFTINRNSSGGLESVQADTNGPRGSWKFTIKRNWEGNLESVRADPI